MNDIIKLAQESGLSLYGLGKDRTNFDFIIERFAALVAAAERERIIGKNRLVIEQINDHIKRLEEAVKVEREACAKLCEQMQDWPEDATPYDCAKAIRARGEE